MQGSNGFLAKTFEKSIFHLQNYPPAWLVWTIGKCTKRQRRLEHKDCDILPEVPEEWWLPLKENK